MAAMNTSDPPFKRIRNRLGMSQQQLADAMGTAQSNVAGYDKGSIRVPLHQANALIKVASERGLEIDLNHILGGAELPPPPPESGPQAAAPAAPQAFPALPRRATKRGA